MVATEVIWLENGQHFGSESIKWERYTEVTDATNRGQVTGWAGLIRVDNNVYTWMGAPGPQTVTQTAFSYTSTKSVFTLNVNNMVEMNVTFLSPLTPNDLKRQSLVFSYLDVVVRSTDGAQHNVQVYTDMSAGRLL